MHPPLQSPALLCPKLNIKLQTHKISKGYNIICYATQVFEVEDAKGPLEGAQHDISATFGRLKLATQQNWGCRSIGGGPGRSRSS